MRNLTAFSLAIVLGFATYGLASLGSSSSEAEACGMRVPPPAADISGAYDSNYGTVILKQDGRRVTGSYECCGGGTIQGTMSGNRISFTWKQFGSTGRGTWVLDKDKQTLTGNWGYDGSVNDGGHWNLHPRPAMVARR